MEFSSREWMKVGANKIEVEPKEACKEKCGRSPDLADAVAIGFFGAIKRGFRIQRLHPEKPATRNRNDWKAELRKKEREMWAEGQLEVHPA